MFDCIWEVNLIELEFCSLYAHIQLKIVKFKRFIQNKTSETFSSLTVSNLV